MMRVAVTGTHGVGKTTLVEELGKRLGFPVISEAARTVIPSFGYSDTDDYIRRADKPRKFLVQSQILLQQMNAENGKVGFLSDRAVIDPVAYAAAFGLSEWLVAEMLGKAITHALRVYDLVVYLPPVVPLVDDGFRNLDEKLRRRVDRYIRRYVAALERLGVRVLRVRSKRLEDRVCEVMASLEALRAKEEVANGTS